jgi:alkylation response protein AidB-like acyl-CoA dehydrogenase
MELSLSADQAAILDALEVLLRPYVAMPVDMRHFALPSPDLDHKLAEGGYLDVAFDPDLGATTAALILERIARLPYAVEAAASLLIRPLFGELPRPICLLETEATMRPVRYLQPGASVIALHADKVTSFTASPEDVRQVESIYAHPVAMLNVSRELGARAQAHTVSPLALQTRWRVALAAEAAGLLGAAIDSTVTYVSERKQFGRPLATFQAIRHRLAEASVRATGVKWLALKAAASDDAGDAALAAHYAQDSATKIVYDLHQFLGGMGMTLEHPLHLWTYRLKALLADLGGRQVQAAAAAGFLWDQAAE